GFGVFLSEHDLFIQQNFFSNPQQVAWVYDPHTDEEGCFGWIGDKIEKLNAIRVGYSQSVEIANTSGHNDEEMDDDQAVDSMLRSSSNEKSPSREPAWVKWVSLTVGYLSALLLGFSLGYFFMNWRVAPLVDRLEKDEQLIEGLRQHPEIFNPGALSVFGLSQPAGAPGQPQPAPQQPAPAQQTNDTARGKETNGRN